MEPVFADLNGGLLFVPDFKGLMTNLHKEIMETSEVRKAVIREIAVEDKIVNGEDSQALY